MNDIHRKNVVLILAPHTDDGELGCGGAISKFIEEKKQVYYAAFSICEDSVPEGLPSNILEFEVKEATKALGIKSENLIIKNYPVRKFNSFRQEILEDLIILKNEVKPDLVFLPSSFDVHQDHNTMFQEGRRAFKNISMLGYEFMWNNFSFSSSAYIKLQKRHVEKKKIAISKYKSQEKRFYAKDKMIEGLAVYRGLQISTEYAEAFEVIRWII